MGDKAIKSDSYLILFILFQFSSGVKDEPEDFEEVILNEDDVSDEDDDEKLVIKQEYSDSD
jgi:hypothetical protein